MENTRKIRNFGMPFHSRHSAASSTTELLSPSMPLAKTSVKPMNPPLLKKSSHLLSPKLTEKSAMQKIQSRFLLLRTANQRETPGMFLP